MFVYFPGILIGQYLQRINSRLDLGAELVYQYGPQIPGEQLAILSLAGRLNGKRLILYWYLIVSPVLNNLVPGSVFTYLSLYLFEPVCEKTNNFSSE